MIQLFWDFFFADGSVIMEQRSKNLQFIKNLANDILTTKVVPTRYKNTDPQYLFIFVILHRSLYVNTFYIFHIC